MSKLYLFTFEFPFGTQETFLENEIPILADYYDEIVLVPEKAEGDRREIPANARVLELNQMNEYRFGRVSGLLQPSLILVMLGEFITLIKKTNIRGKRLIIISFLHSVYNIMKQFLHNIYMGRELYRRLWDERTGRDVTCYAYWFGNWATSLAYLVRTRKIDRFIARAHRFDLYEEKRTTGVIPFRNFQLQMVDRLHCVSEDGARYIKEKYPRYSSKITVSRLGTHDWGLNPFREDKSAFMLVSCSNLIPVKRIGLLVEALLRIPFPLKWIHFGDGELWDELHKRARTLPGNIMWEIRDRIPNRDLMKFYQQEPVDLFINVSASEGIPVSLMEAASFGIPLMATDVGGNAEIVTDRTGILLPSDPGPEEIARAVAEFTISEKHSIKFREGVRAYWNEYYNAYINYNTFCKEMLRQDIGD